MHLAEATPNRLEEALMRLSLVVRLAAVLPSALLGEARADGGAQVVYEEITLPSLGGTLSSGNGINDLEWVTGSSTLPGNQSVRATLWREGRAQDLGTLGGASSNVVWPIKNTVGLISGISETTTVDPLGEQWSCSAFIPNTGHTCLGTVWEFGTIRALPTLGGNNGFATGSNDRRQVVGWAENTVHDPSCTSPQVLQFRAVLWGPGRDAVRELSPLPGDSTSAATGINDRGVVIGISGNCGTAVGASSARHAVIWEDGIPRDIGNLGGIAWNTPMALNRRGEVVGFSNISASDGDNFNAQAFLWTRRDGIRKLGTLPGDALSEALGINSWGQVVGISCTAGFVSCRGFLWQDGVITDLNTLIVSGNVVPIFAAGDIDDFGRITGQTLNPTTGEQDAFLALPMFQQGATDNAFGRPAMPALPEQLRSQLLRRHAMRVPFNAP
jgi:probable HAF family extracellular repeat protein